MRMLMVCFASMSVVLASCAESVHQRERIGAGSDLDQAPPVSYESAEDYDSPDVPVEFGSIAADSTSSVFSELKAAADRRGQVVTLSGTVLKAKRLNGLTEIEILHLPTDAGGRPTEDRRRSHGRFLAWQTTTFLDPAILATGPMVTVQGRVEEMVERPLEPGADNYSYPVLAIQQLTVWPSELLQAHRAPYISAAGSAGSYQGNAAPNFALDFVGSILTGFIQSIFNSDRGGYRSSSSSPSARPPRPPEKDIPPQFKKKR